MTKTKALGGSGAGAIVPVPPFRRPRSGPQSVPLHVVLQRVQEAFDASVAGSEDQLALIVDRLANAGSESGCPKSDLQVLMIRANDVRGVAKTLGSELVAEVADTVFSIAEAALLHDTLPRPLLILLTQSCQLLMSEPLAATHEQYAEPVRTLMADVRKRADWASARPSTSR